jgi:hypothetical protein
VRSWCLPLPTPGPGPEVLPPTPETEPTLPEPDLVAPQNELTLRIEGILKDNSDGEVGVFLKRLDDGDGLVLASGNATTIFEPASAIKVLHLLHAMLQVQEDDDISLSTQIPWNEGSTNEEEPHKGCPLDPTPDSITLEKALEQMMRISDNRTTQAVRVFFGQDEINQTAQMLDMNQTLVQHRIGCAGDVKNEDDAVIDFGAISHHNQTTLVDLGLLYQKVVQDQVLDAIQKPQFFSIMSNQSNSTFFNEVADEEANVVCLDPERTQRFKSQLRFAWKGGSYNLSDLKYRSVAGWIEIPFLVDGVVEPRDYIFGVFIDGAENLDGDFSIFDPAKELLRDEIRAAMVTYQPGGFGG